MSELIAAGISAEIMNVLEAQGLPVRTSLDLDIPSFPQDVTLLDDQDLMMLAAKYMEHYNFVSTQVAIAAVAEMEAEDAFDYAHSRALLQTSTGKSTEKAVMLKAAVMLDDEVTTLRNRKMHAYAYRKMLETTQSSLERYYYLTSRELTRRTHGDKMKTNKFFA
jgi:hypothetical protein